MSSGSESESESDSASENESGSDNGSGGRDSSPARIPMVGNAAILLLWAGNDERHDNLHNFLQIQRDTQIPRRRKSGESSLAKKKAEEEAKRTLPKARVDNDGGDEDEELYELAKKESQWLRVQGAGRDGEGRKGKEGREGP